MRLLAAPDACVVIAGLLVRPTQPNRAESRIVTLAEERAFDILLVENVEWEIRRALMKAKKEQSFDAFLTRANIIRCNAASKVDVQQHERQLLAIMRHTNDVPIAVALKLSQQRPHAFISSNSEHWTPKLELLLAGIRMMTPKQFAAELMPQSRR